MNSEQLVILNSLLRDTWVGSVIVATITAAGLYFIYDTSPILVWTIVISAIFIKILPENMMTKFVMRPFAAILFVLLLFSYATEPYRWLSGFGIFVVVLVSSMSWVIQHGDDEKGLWGLSKRSWYYDLLAFLVVIAFPIAITVIVVASSSPFDEHSEYQLGLMDRNAQLAAVKQSGRAIEHIKNPTEEMQLAAVKYSGWAIENIKNPTEKVQLVAVKQDGWAIEYIKNPTEKVQLTAIKQDGRAIMYIKNPTKEMQLAAVKQYGEAIKYIKNPTKEVQLAAVKQDGEAIEYIINPTEEMQLLAVKQHWKHINRIKYPTEKVQLVAVKQDGEAINYIKNPTEKVQLAAEKNK